MPRKSMTFYESFFRAARKMSKMHRLEYYEAIFEFGFYDKEPENLSETVESHLILVMPNLRTAARKSEEYKRRRDAESSETNGEFFAQPEVNSPPNVLRKGNNNNNINNNIYNNTEYKDDIKDESDSFPAQSAYVPGALSFSEAIRDVQSYDAEFNRRRNEMLRRLE